MIDQYNTLHGPVAFERPDYDLQASSQADLRAHYERLETERQVQQQLRTLVNVLETHGKADDHRAALAALKPLVEAVLNRF